MGTSIIRPVTALVVVAAVGLGACGGDSHKAVSASSSRSPVPAVSASRASASTTTTSIATTTSSAAASSAAASTAATTTIFEPAPSDANPGAPAPPPPAPSPPATSPATTSPPTTTVPATTSPPPPSAPGSISIKGFTFSPNPLHVGVGATVTTTNDETAVSHTWTSDTGAWDSGTLAPGASYSFTFSSPGTYEYHCSIHSSMKGSVVVS